jgi:hypothetical protein
VRRLAVSGKCSKCATHPVTVGIIVAHKMLKRSLARTTEWIYSSARIRTFGKRPAGYLAKEYSEEYQEEWQEE